MTAPSDSNPRTQDTIRAIVDMLHDAYQQTCGTADPASPRVDLGLGIYLARAQVCRWLAPAPSPVPDRSRRQGASVPELLREAERRTCDLPLDSSDYIDVAELTITLCGLIREADHVAW